MLKGRDDTLQNKDGWKKAKVTGSDAGNAIKNAKNSPVVDDGE